MNIFIYIFKSIKHSLKYLFINYKQYNKKGKYRYNKYVVSNIHNDYKKLQSDYKKIGEDMNRIFK